METCSCLKQTPIRGWAVQTFLLFSHSLSIKSTLLVDVILVRVYFSPSIRLRRLCVENKISQYWFNFLLHLLLPAKCKHQKIKQLQFHSDERALETSAVFPIDVVETSNSAISSKIFYFLCCRSARESVLYPIVIAVLVCLAVPCQLTIATCSIDASSSFNATLLASTKADV